MKILKVLFFIVMVETILFVFTVSVEAIGFSAEEVYESVFVVYSDNFIGSGFAIGKNCIVTNAHVIANKNDVIVRTYGGEQYKAYVIDMDEGQDIAILGIANVEFSFLPVADYSVMNIGDDVYAIGAPKSMAYTLTKGVISAKERKVGKYNYIQIDAAINEGNSGGPLLNDLGQVIGMNTLKMSDSEGIGLAIPINNVCDYLKSLNIVLDQSGNIAGNIEIDEINQNKNENKIDNSNGDNESTNTEDIDLDENKELNDINSFPMITTIAFAIAGISIVGNIVLVIMLVYQKKKDINLKYNPSERTDFEIDILE